MNGFGDLYGLFLLVAAPPWRIHHICCLTLRNMHQDQTCSLLHLQTSWDQSHAVLAYRLKGESGQSNKYLHWELVGNLLTAPKFERKFRYTSGELTYPTFGSLENHLENYVFLGDMLVLGRVHPSKNTTSWVRSISNNNNNTTPYSNLLFHFLWGYLEEVASRWTRFSMGFCQTFEAWFPNKSYTNYPSSVVGIYAPLREDVEHIYMESMIPLQ